MTPERFRTIVDAYGADARHWPAGERASAQAWAEQHRDEAHALLAASAQLDAWLESDAPPLPDAALTRRIVASAPAARAATTRARVWWSGAAFVGAGLAGALAGAFVVSLALLANNPPHNGAPDTPTLATSFDGSTSDWSGE
jgi:anti-sigma-K factor RskA